MGLDRIEFGAFCVIMALFAYGADSAVSGAIVRQILKLIS